MKIRCEVLAAETNGDAVSVRLQGKGLHEAQWRPHLSFTLEVPDNPRNRRAFYVGRIVRLSVDPL